VKNPAVEDSPALSKVLSIITKDEVELCRARSKIYSLCSHYSSLFDGESYDVQVGETTFSGIFDGEMSCTGPLQVIGTFHDDEFLWGWNNSSIPPQAINEVKEFCLSEPLLSELVSQNRFTCQAESAEKLCQWIAFKMGFHGAFEAPNQSAIVYLALKLNPGKEFVDTPESSLWCSYCGRSSAMVAQLFQASPTCAVCNVCVRQFIDIMDESKSNGQLSQDSAPYMVPCLLCAEKSPRIFSAYGAICHECLSIPVFQSAVQA